MGKYITCVDYGYGLEYDIINAENKEEAESVAYEIWREGAEEQASYGVMEWTEELEQEYIG